MKRVAVFIDYRNCFHLARSVFASKPLTRATDGQFWPSELAQILVAHREVQLERAGQGASLLQAVDELPAGVRVPDTVSAVTTRFQMALDSEGEEE